MKSLKYPNYFLGLLNNKTFKELRDHHKKLLLDIDPSIKDDDYIEVTKYYKSYKKIISISINGKKYYLNIVNKNLERIYDDTIFHLVSYLKTLNISQRIIDEFLLAFWSDNTTTNEGKKRYRFCDFMEDKKDMLLEINRELNKKEILSKLIDYILFQDDTLHTRISHLLYLKDSKWHAIKREDCLNCLSSSKNESTKGIYIGPFSFQCKKRNLDFNELYEDRRDYAVIKWYNYENSL